MMSLAHPTKKDEYGAIEGRPTLVLVPSEASLPPPPPSPPPPLPSPPPPSPAPKPAVGTQSLTLFDLDVWLQSNNLTHLKELFISHKMTTYDSINTANTNFALLIASPLIIESNIVSDVVIAIQTLHSTHCHPHTPHDDDNDVIDLKPSTQYIVVSNDEHQVLTSLKQYLFEINNIKNELKDIENNYINNKNKIRNNKAIYIEQCKDKINEIFWNLTQIINKRQQLLLKKVNEIYTKEQNENENEHLSHLHNIGNEINDHEKYINKQIYEYKTLIQTRKTTTERRDSIIELGNNTENSHQRRREYIFGEFDKIHAIHLSESNIEFVVDDDYLNKFLVCMQHSFGYILSNIQKPNIKSVCFDCDKLILDIAEYNNKYEITRYELGYCVEYDDVSEQVLMLLNDNDCKSRRNSCSSGSSLFSERHLNVTEGLNTDNTRNSLWRFIDIDRKENKIETEIKHIDTDLRVKSGSLLLKIRMFLLDTDSESKFWSVFSDDFEINLKNIKYIEYSDNIESKEVELVEYFEKYYNLLVSDPNVDEMKLDDEESNTRMFSINPLSGITPHILKENDEDDVWCSFPPKEEMELQLKRKKKKKKKKKQKTKKNKKTKKRRKHSLRHSLNLKLTGLFANKENADVGLKPALSPAQKKIKPFAKRAGHIKSSSAGFNINVMHWSHSMPLDEHRKTKHKKERNRTQSMGLGHGNIDIETVKILLLGATDGGKTTIFKQIKHINGDGFTKWERKQFIILIFQQILDSFRCILDKIDEFSEEKQEKNEEYFMNYNDEYIANAIDTIRHKWSANHILKHILSGFNLEFNTKIKKYLDLIWNLNCVKNMYKFKRREIDNLSDSISYFMDNLDRILSSHYTPTLTDILLIRNRSSGMNKIKINSNGFTDNLCVNNADISDIKTVTICDFGGGASERKKWRYHFIGVYAVLYVVSLSCFDEKCFENMYKYKMELELNVFNEYINCDELKDKQWILLLNKVDLFATKIKKEDKTISICFKDYNDDDNEDNEDKLNKSIQYISNRFSSLNKGKHKLYTHITCAIDTKFMKRVMDDIFHIIINCGNNSVRVF